jgi:transcriptional regulator with XRE-family HTH domain
MKKNDGPPEFDNRDVAVAFGQVLRVTRGQQGISQDSLALKCGFDRTYPSLLERGLRGPTIAMLLRLASALEVGPGQLLTDTVARLRADEPPGAGICKELGQ